MTGYGALGRTVIDQLHDRRPLRFIDTGQTPAFEALTGNETAQSRCPAKECQRLVACNEVRHDPVRRSCHYDAKEPQSYLPALDLLSHGHAGEHCCAT